MAAMVTTATQTPITFEAPPESIAQTASRPTGRHDVPTSINYYKDPGDGSLPMPIIIAE